METGNYQKKQRGFTKSKIARNFSRGFMKRSWTGQCSSSTTTTSSSKVRPSPPSARNGSGTSGPLSYLSVHQDLQNHPSSSMQKVAPNLSPAKPTSYGYFDYGQGGGDENVDMKATDFIFYVRERFKQERPVDSNAF